MPFFSQDGKFWQMLEAGEILHPKKMIGNLPGWWCSFVILRPFLLFNYSLYSIYYEIYIPLAFLLVMTGIEVGHQFYSRAEMVAVGFHSHWLNGIDYMGQSYKKQVMISFVLEIFQKGN